MSGNIILKASAGGSTSLKADDTLSVDEEVVITKALMDKLEALDPKSLATAYLRGSLTGGVMTIKEAFNMTATRTGLGLILVTPNVGIDLDKIAITALSGFTSISSGSVASNTGDFTSTTFSMDFPNSSNVRQDVDDFSITIVGGKN